MREILRGPVKMGCGKDVDFVRLHGNGAKNEKACAIAYAEKTCDHEAQCSTRCRLTRTDAAAVGHTVLQNMP